MQDIDAQGVNRGQGHIEAKVKLLAINKIRIGDVLLDEGVFGFEV